MTDDMIEPLKAYQSHLAQDCARNTAEYFNDLVKKSGLDEAENRKTVAEYRETLKKAEEARQKVASMKGLKVFVIIVMVLAFVAAAVFLLIGILGEVSGEPDAFPLWASILIACGGIGLGIGMIFVLTKAVNTALKRRQKKLRELEEKANALLAKAWEQMAPLNNLFHWDMTRQIIDKTTPLIKLDKSFDMKKLDFLQGKYGLTENEDPNVSTLEILSGSIVGNPFIVERELVHEMGSKTYFGSRVVTWTETRWTSDGVETVTHTQTLTASVTKPYPEYYGRTDLIYGNEAAPDLSFSRVPSGANNMNEKQIAKYIFKEQKAIQKQAKKAVGNANSNFTEMANTDFEVLFGARNRNNEVQFRLLFTPLAQRNMVDLIKSKVPYGDDFRFHKQNCLNMIVSDHAQRWDMDLNPVRYYTYDIDECRNRFTAFNQEYFRSLYFDLAPLMSIPLYQQQKSREYIYGLEYSKNYTRFEAESVANAFNPAQFLHPDSRTQGILKANFVEKDGDSDRVRVAAYSYAGIDRVDFIPVLCGDGHYYDVPVPWVEYIPVSKETNLEIKEFNNDVKDEFVDRLNLGSFRDYISKYTSEDNCIFHRGFLAMLVGTRAFSSADDAAMNSTFLKPKEAVRPRTAEEMAQLMQQTQAAPVTFDKGHKNADEAAPQGGEEVAATSNEKADAPVDVFGLEESDAKPDDAEDIVEVDEVEDANDAEGTDETDA